MSWEDNVRKVVPYVAGEQPKGKVIKLNTNEFPYAPSPKVADRLKSLSLDEYDGASSRLKKYPDMDSEKLCKGMREMMNYSQYTTKITKIMNEKYQVPTVGTGSLLPFELLFWLKGIKGMGIDLRRKKE